MYISIKQPKVTKVLNLPNSNNLRAKTPYYHSLEFTKVISTKKPA